MTKRRIVLTLLGAIVLGLAGWGGAAYVESRRVAGLVESLRQGGYVLYFRHADREKGDKEKLDQNSPLSDFADCSTQRNLTAKGRAQAEALGAIFRDLGIPLGRIRANPQCRTRDTAMLAFGRADLEPKIFDPEYVRGLLGEMPLPGTDSVIIGNEFQMRMIAGFELDKAEAAILKPDGKGGFVLIGRIEFSDWPRR